MQQQSQERVRFLENKVKMLQREIAERVRSFLLHNNKKGSTANKLVSCQKQAENRIQRCKSGNDVSVQTQQSEENFFNGYNLLKQSGVTLFQATSQSQINQNFKQDCSPIRINQESNLSTENNDFTLQANRLQAGAKLIKLIQNDQQPQQLESSAFQQESVENQVQISREFYKKQRKKLRRQIGKLKQKLEFLQTVSYQAKEGLLLSEEENYSFRIKISEMSKEAKKLNHEKSELNRRIELLQAHNLALKDSLQQAGKSASTQPAYLHQSPRFGNQQMEARYKEMQDFFDVLKNKLYSIASLLPAKTQYHQASMFRPQNEEEILQIMHQIEAYFVEAEKTYESTMEQVNNSKNIFISTIKVVNQLIDHQLRLQILQKLSQFTEVKHYLKIFNKTQVQS